MPLLYSISGFSVSKNYFCRNQGLYMCWNFRITWKSKTEKAARPWRDVLSPRSCKTWKISWWKLTCLSKKIKNKSIRRFLPSYWNWIKILGKNHKEGATQLHKPYIMQRLKTYIKQNIRAEQKRERKKSYVLFHPFKYLLIVCDCVYPQLHDRMLLFFKATFAPHHTRIHKE